MPCIRTRKHGTRRSQPKGKHHRAECPRSRVENSAQFAPEPTTVGGRISGEAERLTRHFPEPLGLEDDGAGDSSAWGLAAAGVEFGSFSRSTSDSAEAGRPWSNLSVFSEGSSWRSVVLVPPPACQL